MKAPNTEIRCNICHGTKLSKWAHPSHKAACGACFGTGLSTAPYDQARYSTMVGVGEEDLQRIGSVFHAFNTLAEKKAAWLALCAAHGRTEENAPLIDLQFHSEGPVDTKSVKPRWTGILISWVNRQYASRLELDKQDLLYVEAA